VETQVDEEEAKQGGEIKLPPLLSEKPRIKETDYPSLYDSVKAKTTKAKAKKNKPVDLKEFLSGGTVAAKLQAKRLDEAVARLPTGPRARNDDDLVSGLGGGFKGFSGSRTSLMSRHPLELPNRMIVKDTSVLWIRLAYLICVVYQVFSRGSGCIPPVWGCAVCVGLAHWGAKTRYCS
jgi:hypothetical protein